MADNNSTEPRCKNCRFWERMFTDEDADEDGNDHKFGVGRCSRFPPVLLHLDERLRCPTHGHENWAQPVTRESDWCGEFQISPPRQERVSEEVLNEVITVGLISLRAYNCLAYPGDHFEPIRTIGELLQCTADDLLERRNLGKVSLSEIRGMLHKKGLYLKEDWPLPKVLGD